MAAKKKTKKKVTNSDIRESADDVKLLLMSMNIVDDRLEQLKILFPEVFAKDKIDFNKLKGSLSSVWISKSIF